LRVAGGAEVSVRDIFEHPTVASMAEHICAALAGGEATPLPPVKPVPRDGNLPLSFAQQRLWFLSQLTPESPYYNLTAATRIRGALDVVTLERALGEIITRHESLRTNFRVLEGQPVQQIRPEAVLSLATLDLRDLAEDVREGEVSRLMNEDACKPFDLERDMLLRARLLRLADEEHVLVLVMHHIVSDGWSTNVFAKELAELYAAYSAGMPSPLAELPVQYADYASWQRRWMEGGTLEEQLRYWRERLADAPQVLELPTDRPRPPAQSFAGGRHRLGLGVELSAGLRRVARREGVTEFMLLLAGWGALLLRYCGQGEVVIGTPVAGRTLPETEGLIGFFVNTLALRVGAGAGETFSGLLGRVREVCLGAYAHQEAPFERVVEELGVARDLSRHPVFQVAIALQDAPEAPLQLPGLDLSPLEAESQTAKFDLTLFVRESPSGELDAELEYDTALFAPETAGRMTRHFVTLLRGAVADPKRKLSELPLLTAEEREQVRLWNETVAPFPSGRMVHELFEEQAARTPETVAVVAGRQSITYRELNERANQLAHHLRARGVAAESVVALSLERSVEMIVAMLGAIKAGAAYLPLDPEYPRERLAFMLEDAAAAVLLTQEHLLPVLPTQSARQVICLDRDWSDVARESNANPPNLTGSENIVYLIYTSGSTGVPKGVMVKQVSLVNLCYALKEFFAADEVRRTALITSISFDISVNQIFPTLLFGKTLHVIANEVKYDGRALMNYVAAAGIDLMDCVPSYLHNVLTRLSGEQLGRHFKYLLIGGEKVERGLLRKVFAQLGEQVQVVNIYGLTELTDINALSRIGSREAEEVVTVGRPIANTQVYITNPGGELQPVGVTGELCIGGVGVSRGYRNRPAMTAEKFAVNPYGNGESMYRTGDVGRWLADGRIEVLGRLDHQVKVRGFRIELGEIEAALAQHEEVAEAVVVAREEESGDRRLAAYVVGREGPAPAAERLRQHLLGRLPEYMIPSYFVSLPSLPRTPNGKLDRRALPPPTAASTAASAAFVAPRTPLEEVLADIWAGVLDVERVGIDDNFFSLGGHSLLAIQLVSEIRDTLQVTLPLRTIFEYPTVLGLSAFMLQDPGQQQSLEKKAEMLVKLSLISDDEVEVMLEGKASSDKEIDAP
jgi:amino acid adenylation domain-containing protein